MPYTAVLCLTHGDHTFITHLSEYNGNVWFGKFGGHTLIFKSNHDVRDKIRSLYFGLLNTPKPGFIKGSTVQYRALPVDPGRVQWPIGWEQEWSNPPGTGDTTVIPAKSACRSESLRLSWLRRKEGLRSTRIHSKGES